MAKKSNKIEGTLDRREVVGAILEKREDALVVTGLGSSCYDAGVHDQRSGLRQGDRLVVRRVERDEVLLGQLRHGTTLLDRPPDEIEVTVPRRSGARSRPGVRVRRRGGPG